MRPGPSPQPSCPVLLLLCADPLLHASLAEYLAGCGHRDGDPVEAGAPVSAVVVDADAWPPSCTQRHLRSRFPRTPCILMSGSPLVGPDTVVRLRRGFFLPKPVRPWELARLIEQAVDGYLGPGAARAPAATSVGRDRPRRLHRGAAPASPGRHRRTCRGADRAPAWRGHRAHRPPADIARRGEGNHWLNGPSGCPQTAA
jgi:hypothetical protein